MSLPSDSQIGQYRIVEQIGVGGMATVYKAAQPKLDRYVAIKIMHQAFLQDPAFRSRFEREARIVARLEHANIVPIYDYDDLNGQPYLVMKLISGHTLKEMLQEGALSLEEIQRLIPRIADALTYAHTQGILHRDIKPSNIIIDEGGTPYLTDFGLARITQLGESTMSADMMLGTPHYISPEQAQGTADIDARTDVYSLGVILYELVTGRVPFTGETTYAIVHKHIYAAPPPPSQLNPEIPAAVEAVLLKALEKNPINRYDTPNTMMTAFQQAIAQSGLKQLDESRVVTAKAVVTPPEYTPGGNKYISIPAPIERPNPLPGEQRLNDFFRQMSERVQEIASEIQRSETWGKISQAVRENIHIDPDGNSIKIGKSDKSGMTINANGVIDFKEDEEKRRAKAQKMIAQDWGTDEQSIRRRVDKRIKERAGFLSNLVSFLVTIPISLLLEPVVKNFIITGLPDWAPEDAPALIAAVQQTPMAILLLFPWMGGLIAHGLQVFYTSGRRLQARRRAQQKALVASYGEDWQETIDYKDYKRIRNRVEDRYKGRLNFMQHAVSAFFIGLMGLTAWPAIRDLSIHFLETDTEVINFISTSAIPVAFIVIMLFSLLLHGIVLGINIIAGDDARENAVEQEIARERQRAGLGEKAKRDQTKLKVEDLNVRMNDDGEFTDSFISELENAPDQRTR